MKLPIKPLYLTDVDLLFGTRDPATGVVTWEADDYSHHVSNVTLTPSTNAASWQGLSPASSHTAQSPATWAAAVSFAQDWDSAKSLSRYLWDNRGAERVMKLKPRASGTAEWSVDVTLVPGPIGGAVNAHAVSTVTMGVTGEPELLPAA